MADKVSTFKSTGSSSERMKRLKRLEPGWWTRACRSRLEHSEGLFVLAIELLNC